LIDLRARQPPGLDGAKDSAVSPGQDGLDSARRRHCGRDGGEDVEQGAPAELSSKVAEDVIWDGEATKTEVIDQVCLPSRKGGPGEVDSAPARAQEGVGHPRPRFIHGANLLKTNRPSR
jgi:hypothetical protein